MNYTTEKPIKNLRKTILLLVILLSACAKGAENQISATSTPSPIQFSLTEIPTEQAMPYFQDEFSNEIFLGIEEMKRSGFRTLQAVARFGHSEDNLTSGTYVILEPGQALTGYLRPVNTLKFPHDFGMLATLDYLPIQIQYNGGAESFPTLHLDPNIQRTFKFHLPPLSEGLHSLVLKFIIAPNHFFAFHSTTSDPIEDEALSFRDAPIEFGLLIWVTDSPPQSILDWPQQARSIPPENTTLLTDAFLVKEKPKDGQPEMMLNTDTVHAGKTVTYYIHPIAADLGEGDIPLRVLVFWDDILTQTDNLLIPIQTAVKQEYIPYKILVPAHLSEGNHYLTVIGYPYPYYLRWWENSSEWRTEVGPYSNLMLRIPVLVEK